jgi:predicted enzyme involved in methoxymalonyl-ACP biosynthesis
MLAFISEQARQRGYARLVGEYVPTERNHVVSELYPQMRFNLERESDGASVYCLDLASEEIEYPESVSVLSAQ